MKYKFPWVHLPSNGLENEKCKKLGNDNIRDSYQAYLELKKKNIWGGKKNKCLLETGKQTIHLLWSDFPKSKKKNIVVSFSLKPVLDIETVG